jgi:hypothetical protein
MASDRRKPSRVRVKWPVVLLTAKGVVLAETRDISSDGAFIHCKLPLPPKEKLRLFIMAPNQRPIDIPAEVARGMGVQFIKISKANSKSLRNVLGKHYKKKARQSPERK